MASILPFDELNAFKLEIEQRFPDKQLQKQGKNANEEDIVDELLDLFLLAYAMGNSVTNDNLSSSYEPSLDDVMKTVDAKVAGKTWRERVKEYFDKARKGEIPVVSAGDTERRQEESGGSSGQRGQTEAGGSGTPSGGVSLQDAIIRIAETETHRIANTAALDSAKYAGASFKTWATMLDDRVREDHEYLEGVTVGIDEDFYTYGGAHAPAPGMFGIPEEDINCRCELLFS